MKTLVSFTSRLIIMVILAIFSLSLSNCCKPCEDIYEHFSIVDLPFFYGVHGFNNGRFLKFNEHKFKLKINAKFPRTSTGGAVVGPCHCTHKYIYSSEIPIVKYFITSSKPYNQANNIVVTDVFEYQPIDTLDTKSFLEKLNTGPFSGTSTFYLKEAPDYSDTFSFTFHVVDSAYNVLKVESLPVLISP